MSQVNGDTDLTDNYQTLLRQVSECKESIRLERSKNLDDDMTAVCANIEDVSLTAPVVNFKCRRVLRGHRGRILHFDWSPDKIHVLTAGQDGCALICNGYTGLREVVIQTTTPWVSACAYSPSTTLVVCGGLENQCSVYNVEKPFGLDDRPIRISLPNKMVAQHSKYISQCAFVGSDQQLLTASADSTCGLWELELKKPVQLFTGHRMEVLGLSVHPRDPYTIFASGSCDRSTRVWDIRTGHCEMKYDNQESQITAVKFFPGGEALVSADSDGIIHLYDLRADQEIRLYSKPSILFGASSVEVSKSGRVIFAGYDDYSVRAWDVLKGSPIAYWLHHHDRVSHVLMSPDGCALGTSSWDGTLRIMA